MFRNIGLFMMSALLLGGCSFTSSEDNHVLPDFEQRNVAITTFHYPKSSMTIGMIGDVLLHNPLYTYADYAYSFEDVQERMENIDFLLANQESMPGGETFGYSGYPAFNSPAHIIDGLKNAGVDMVSIANNHTLDYGERGIRAAIDNIRAHDMPYVGAYLSEEDQNEARMMTVNNITLGFLAYTYGTNGIPTPKGKDYLVSRIDPERIAREVEALKENVDVVVVSMHWGDEYKLTPNETQTELAQVIADAGGDIIFGHHPHVLQKFERLQGVDGNDTFVYYSLGNFYSGQKFEYTDIGGIAQLTIVKNRNNSGHTISLEDATFHPTAVVRDDAGIFKVVPLQTVEKDKTVSNNWVLKHVLNH